MKKITFFAIALLAVLQNLSAQEINLYPTNWFVGMKWNQVQILVHGNGEKFNAGEITYNFKTKKGKIKDVITQQGDGFIHGRDIKRDSTNVYYVANGKYTTIIKGAEEGERVVTAGVYQMKTIYLNQ